MLWTIFVILLILWFLGLVSSYTLGGYIHILLVVAVVVLVINLVTGRRGDILSGHIAKTELSCPPSRREYNEVTL